MSLESDTFQKELSQNALNGKISLTTPKKPNQQDKKSYLSRIYWVFIEKKKLKFSHQFPRMTYNEITNKTIREWQTLSMEEKLNLGKTYNIKEEQESDDDNGSNSPLDSRSQEHKISDNDLHNKTKSIKEQKILLQRDSTGAKPSDLIKLNIEDSESQVKPEDIKYQENDQDSEGSSNQNQSPKSKVKKQIGSKTKKSIKKKKNKPIKKPQQLIKLKNGEYILFYKHYQSRLKSQHPKWSSIQINHIILLLWKKKQQQNKKIKQQGIKKQKNVQKNPKKTLKRPISGKQLFSREKKKLQLSKQEIDCLWMQLPRQSKNDWNKRGASFGSSLDQNGVLIKNTKSESSLKTEEKQTKEKTVISFKDVLLKGGFQNEQGESGSLKQILEEKDEMPKRQVTKKQRKVQISQTKQKEQNYEYVSLSTNPLGFMQNKISLEKIVLE